MDSMVNEMTERHIIGALLIDFDCMNDIGNVKSDMFEDDLRGRLFYEMEQAYEKNESVNMATLMQSIASDTMPSDLVFEEIRACMVETSTSADVKTYADALVSSYKARRVNQIASMVNCSPNDVEGQIKAIIEQCESLMSDTDDEDGETLAEITNRVKGDYFVERPISPCKFGFFNLDEMVGGMEKGDTVVIGARPSVGKSAFVTQVAKNLTDNGKKVAMVNLEMSNQQMYERFLVNYSGLSLQRVKRAINFLGSERQKFDEANDKLSKCENIKIYTKGVNTVSDIRRKIKGKGFDILIIDYLQLLEADRRVSNRFQEVGEISRAIKKLAGELDIPIIALSQLNRASEGRDTKEPTMADIRESGSIEQDASVIILLWNLNEERTEKGCKVEKNRQGITGKITMEFDGEHMEFKEKYGNVSTVFTTPSIETPFD